MISNFNWKVI